MRLVTDRLPRSEMPTLIVPLMFFMDGAVLYRSRNRSVLPIWMMFAHLKLRSRLKDGAANLYGFVPNDKLEFQKGDNIDLVNAFLPCMKVLGKELQILSFR